ncbi:MAG: metal ABC transporter substrate-binding protein [Actinomycetota bacterium]
MRRRARAALAAAALTAVVSAPACARSAGDAGDPPDPRLRVVTTVAPITNIAANVAGDLAEITGIVPEGTNSHTFEPPPSAAAVLSEADVVFVNGLKLEDPTLALAAENLKEGAEIVELGDRTIGEDDYIYDFSFPREGGKPNPHLWTNPPMATRYAEVIAAELAGRDPSNAGAYRDNYAAFAARVDRLAEATRTATASVPEANRKLLTYHDGYAYFARDFGWTVIGAIQPSSFDEPSPREVAGLIAQIRAERVPAIFGSEVFPSPVLEQIGREAGVRYVDELRDDDLPGEPGDPEHTWLGLMRFDYVTMVESLGGDASALQAVRVANVTADTATYPQ